MTMRIGDMFIVNGVTYVYAQEPRHAYYFLTKHGDGWTVGKPFVCDRFSDLIASFDEEAPLLLDPESAELLDLGIPAGLWAIVDGGGLVAVHSTEAEAEQAFDEVARIYVLGLGQFLFMTAKEIVDGMDEGGEEFRLALAAGLLEETLSKE